MLEVAIVDLTEELTVVLDFPRNTPRTNG